MALNTAQSIFNLIRTYGSDVYKDAVPALTDKSPIGDVATPILTQPDVYKEFSILLGAFIKAYVDDRIWENPLISLFTNTNQPLGEWSAEIANNPVAPRKYDASHPEYVLQYAMNDDKVLYYVRNVKEFFKVSIALEDMKGAFESYETFNSYVSMKVASQLSGKQISMFNHIFEAIDANYKAGALVTQNTVVPASLDETAIKNFTKSVKSLSKKFTYPSTAYNKYGSLEGANGDFKGFTRPEDVIILATVDYLTAVDVEYLASAFNLDKAEIRDKIYEVNDFGYDRFTDAGVFIEHVDSPIQAIICDRRFFRFSRDLDMNTERFNEETLVTNYWSHAWYTYGINIMANNTAFIATETPTPTPFSVDVEPVTLVIDSTDAEMPDVTSATVTVTPDSVELDDFTFESITFDVESVPHSISFDAVEDYLELTAGLTEGTYTLTVKTGLGNAIRTAYPDIEFDETASDLIVELVGTVTFKSGDISAVSPLVIDAFFTVG